MSSDDAPSTRELTVTIEGEERTARWVQGTGIYVPGHDLNQGDTLTIEGTRFRIAQMRRSVDEGVARTLIIHARELD